MSWLGFFFGGGGGGLFVCGFGRMKVSKKETWRVEKQAESCQHRKLRADLTCTALGRSGFSGGGGGGRRNTSVTFCTCCFRSRKEGGGKERQKEEES